MAFPGKAFPGKHQPADAAAPGVRRQRPHCAGANPPPGGAPPGPAPRCAVWIIDALKPGGAEALALAFAAAPPPGWRVELIALQPPAGRAASPHLATLWGEPAERAAARIHTLAMGSLADLGQWWRLLGLLRRLRPHLIHTHLRYATIWGGWAARRLGVPQVATLHLLPGEEASWRQRGAAALERRGWRRAERVVYVSRAQAGLWGGHLGPAQPSPARVRILANGVETVLAPRDAGARARLRAALDLPPTAFIMATVAVVRARKGWRTWLDAVARIAPERPQAGFVWAGGGPEFELLRTAVASHPARAQIRLLGPRRDVVAWLGACDLFLFPSLEEALPTAVIEAMAAGVAVIASDIPAIAEALGGGGCLLPPGDAPALAQAALAWSAPAGAGARQQAATRGRQRVLASYSRERWREGLVHLYEQMLAENAGGRVLLPRRPAAL